MWPNFIFIQKYDALQIDIDSMSQVRKVSGYFPKYLTDIFYIKQGLSIQW